jgi:hypothetical protein
MFYNMADITISLDDTLELDTIIKKSTSADNPVTYNSNEFNFTGIQTHTGIFDPKKSGTNNITINGQTLTVKVTEPTNIPNSVLTET